MATGQNIFVEEDPWTDRGLLTYVDGEVDVDDLIDVFSDWVSRVHSSALPVLPGRQRPCA
jgi:hypothetical protein